MFLDMKKAYTKPWKFERTRPFQGAVQSMRNGQAEVTHFWEDIVCTDNQVSKQNYSSLNLTSMFSRKGNGVFLFLF